MSRPVKIVCRGCRAKYDVTEFPPFTELCCPECGTVLRTPEPFGRYLLEKLCGTGGMAKIYRAIDPVLSRRVAVKIMRHNPDVTEISGNLFAKARLFAAVSHPHIVPVYDCGREGNDEYLVMQFMDDGDMETRIKARQLPPVQVTADIIRSIASALNYLYVEHRIVHHDVKPSNILLDSDGNVKLTDFDLAEKCDLNGTPAPVPLWGSPGYISPERLYSGCETFKGDIFSLGVTFYELLSGKTPFALQGEVEELYEQRKRPFTPVELLCPDADEKYAQLIARMLSFDENERPGYPEIIRTLG